MSFRPAKASVSERRNLGWLTDLSAHLLSSSTRHRRDPGRSTGHTTGELSQALLETVLLRLGETARSPSPEGKEALDAGQGDTSRPLLQVQPL